MAPPPSDRTSGELPPLDGSLRRTPRPNRGFVDGELDASIRLIRLGAREYDPHLRRFISVDPLVDSSDPQSMNAYAYSNNSPASFSDPDGTM
jgi:RHS repeat-associated protein